MAKIIVSAQVRATVGEATARAVEDRTADLPTDAQCWWCGAVALLGPNDPGEVTLSGLMPQPGVFISLFAHATCRPSHIVAEAEFDASPAAAVPSPVAPWPETALIDGRQVNLKQRPT